MAGNQSYGSRKVPAFAQVKYSNPAQNSLEVSPFLIAFLASLVFIPLAGYALVYSLMVTEIVPADQTKIPMPSVGDRVSVYGVWVQDTELTETGLGGWYEIHPVRHMEINGKSFGDIPYNGELMEGVWNPSRLVLLDKENPYKIANGTVTEVIAMPDGDYHVHVNVNNQFTHLLKPSFFATSLPVYQILKTLSFTPLAVIIGYVVVSIVKSEKTFLGRLTRRKRHQD